MEYDSRCNIWSTRYYHGSHSNILRIIHRRFPKNVGWRQIKNSFVSRIIKKITEFAKSFGKKIVDLWNNIKQTFKTKVKEVYDNVSNSFVGNIIKKIISFNKDFRKRMKDMWQYLKDLF